MIPSRSALTMTSSGRLFLAASNPSIATSNNRQAGTPESAPLYSMCWFSNDDPLAGFYTLTSDNIRVDDLSPELVKQLNLPRYPVAGATLIGRLARDLSFRGQEVSELLLVDALKRSLAVSQQIAYAAVIVDAKDDAARAFYSGVGFMPFPDTARRLFLAMRTVEALFS
jgi:predicted GNAT family N-acyltransferase